MQEDKFIEKIKQRRQQLIQEADEHHISNFAAKEIHRESPRRGPGAATLALLLFLIICSSAGIIYLGTQIQIPTIDKTVTIHTTEQPIVEEHIYQNTYINKTENIIKGKKEMVCIGQINSTKLVCYKEGNNDKSGN